MENLSAPFIFQKERRMSISIRCFQNYGFVRRKVIFNVFTRSDFWSQQKSDA